MNPSPYSSPKYLSRAGKSSSGNSTILRDCSDILTSRRSINTKALPVISEKSKIKELVISEIKKLTEVVSTPEKVIQDAKSSYIFNVISREKYYMTHKIKDKIPPCGHYNVNYNAMERHLSIPNFSAMKIKLLSDIVTPRTLSPPKSKKQKRTIQGVPFCKQLKRSPFYEANISPNENRFEVLNLLPEISTKSRDLKIFNFHEFSPNYCPNKELILQKITKNITFDKTIDRFLYEKHSSGPAPYDYNLDIINRKSSTVDFSKVQGRAKRFKHSSCFLESVRSRASLEGLESHSKQVLQ